MKYLINSKILPIILFRICILRGGFILSRKIRKNKKKFICQNYQDMLLKILNATHPNIKILKNYPSCDFVPETIGFIEVLHSRNVPKNLPLRLQIERLCTVYIVLSC
jgi:hypothetical protein